MVGWHSKELGDGVEAFDPTTEIQESFLTLVQTQAQTGITRSMPRSSRDMT